MNHQKFLVVILGPTGIGKTTLAIEVAKYFETEIISADSRQFFNELSIGTAKPRDEELKQIKHYFINSLSIKDDYNVGKFETDVIHLLENLFQKKNCAIMVGGSGLYVDAVCKGLDELPEADEEIRNQLTELYKTKGISTLCEMLKELDPEHYKKADMANPHRMIRALEVCLLTGKPYSILRKGKQVKRNFSVVKIGLNTDREKLYERINQRVDEMMSAGLLNEVKTLLKFRDKNALLTVGYKELFGYLDGKMDLNSTVELIKKNTRNFAKRQLTWFRRDKEIKWFEPHQADEIFAYINEQIVDRKTSAPEFFGES